MRTWIKLIIPTAESVRRSRWLRWLGPWAQHPRLWLPSRRGLALGIAIGVFFGLLIPLAQIPFSAAAAVVVRANLPAAVAGTLVTNPVTVGPVYYAAWRLGNAVLGIPGAAAEEPAPSRVREPDADGHWFAAAMARVTAVGKPLLVGLAIIATCMGLLTYLLVSWAWSLATLWQRRHRQRGGTA